VKRLLAEARAWCAEERGRQTKLVAYLGVSRHSLNAWFAEARRERLLSGRLLARALTAGP
jgi:hypothetical protein